MTVLSYRPHITFPLLLAAIAICPTIASAQANQPMDFIDQPEGMINCLTTGTTTTTPWGHRFTYWISGFATFDQQGHVRSIPTTESGNWLLSITNSRFPSAESHPLTLLSQNQSENLDFTFPAVSLPEWERLEQTSSSAHSIALSYDDATYGLYVAIRNTAFTDTVRPMVQVIHHLSEDVVITSEAAPCFIGPRPPSSSLPFM